MFFTLINKLYLDKMKFSNGLEYYKYMYIYNLDFLIHVYDYSLQSTRIPCRFMNINFIRFITLFYTIIESHAPTFSSQCKWRNVI